MGPKPAFNVLFQNLTAAKNHKNLRQDSLPTTVTQTAYVLNTCQTHLPSRTLFVTAVQGVNTSYYDHYNNRP